MSKSYEIRPEWFKKTDNLKHIISSWCKKKSDTDVLCVICNKVIFCQKKGFAALTQHAATGIHIRNASLKLSNNQLLLKPRESGSFSCSSSSVSSASDLVNLQTDEASNTPTPIPKPNIATSVNCKQLGLFNNQELCAKAELIWALKSVQCNMAAGACDDLKEVFNCMFPHAVPANFSLGRTKLNYLIMEALGPYFHENLIADARSSPFSLLYDETTNYANQKELQFVIRFWSEKEKEIVCHHLKTVFLGHATALDIKKQIISVLNDSKLSKNKLMMLGSDGPNVNVKVWNLMNNELIEERGQGLVDIGTCNLHVMHNAFLKGIDNFGENAKELIVDVYSFFKKYPSRWEDYEEIQQKLGVERNHFIKHVSTRWLTVGLAAERLLSQWLAVEEYFLKFVPSKAQALMKSEKYKCISKSLKYVDIKVELKFLAESANLFEPFLKLFQKSEPLIPIPFSELDVILKKIAGRICKHNEINVHGVISSTQLLPIADIYCSKDIKELSACLKESDLMSCKHKMQKHYLATFNYIVRKTSLDTGKFLSYFKCLQPVEVAKPKSLKYVCHIAKLLSFLEISDVEVRDEWLLLQTELKSPNPDSSKLRIDHFWKDIIYETNSLGKCKYPTLAIFIKACLALSHGNSDVERGFSISHRVMSQEKASMSEKMLNARLNVRDGIKKYQSVSQVPITKELLNLSYNAYNSYKRHLEEQRKLKEQQLKEAAVEEEKRKKSEIEEKILHTKRETIITLEKKVKVLSEEHKELQSSADGLLNVGNERLKDAIKKNDAVQIRIAQGILEAAGRERIKEREHEEKTLKINRIVHKRKTSLIDLVSKNSKKS